eukprot:6550447-Pyramimonas_sp.AAC.2
MGNIQPCILATGSPHLLNERFSPLLSTLTLDLQRDAECWSARAPLSQVKLATLGNIRLIGELFKEKMIMEKILHACILDLLGKPKEIPPEENMEALCQLLTTGARPIGPS